MVAIPKRVTTLSEINKKKFGGKPRTYLGMSGIGHPCLRKQFYDFHWARIKKHDAQRERIFSVGHLFEQIAIADLKSIGYEVFKVIDGKEIEMFGTVDEDQEEIIGFANHAKGHPDGRVRNVIEAPKTVHLLELKTMGQKYFKSLERFGLKKSNAKYYGQVQRYMAATELTRCLFVAINKNTCEYYITRVTFDPAYAENLVMKEKEIILSDQSPTREFKKDYWECNMCDSRKICWREKKVAKNCRTCEFVDLEIGGVWDCQKKKKHLSEKEQRKGCKSWKRREIFMITQRYVTLKG